MANKSDLLTQSLIDYINDVKPYHTKFRDVTSQIFFNDSLQVNIKEDYLIQSNFQNSWSVDDIGGYLLSNVSDGAYTESLAFSGTGNGYLSFIAINPLSAIVENWTLIALSSSIFSVTGSISGIKQNATVGVLYDNGIISFTIAIGQRAFATGDSFTFAIVGNQSYPIPATIFPRFSLTDRASYGQSPIGDDPSSLNLADLPINTTTESHQHASQMIPVKVPVISTAQVSAIFQIVVDDADEFNYSFDPSTLNITINGTTWLGAYTKVGNVISITTVVTPVPINIVEVLYLGTGRYATPYHQGSRVSVNGVDQPLGVNFTIDATRSFIQFLPTHHPTTGTIIDINLFRSDRFFICWQDPFAFKTTQDSFTISAVAAPGIINAGSFVIGTTYSVTSIGSTDFTLIGGLNVIGTVFTATGVGAGTGTAATNIVLAGSFLTNTVYTIASIGTTNFTLIGAASNTVGSSFTATGPGTGTGIAVPAIICNVSFTNTQPNTHKAILQNVSVSNFANIGDVWTLTATGPWSFSIQQTTPMNSTITQAQFKSPYNDGILSFMIERTWNNYYADPLDNGASNYTSYYIEQDLNSYISYGQTQLGVSDGHDDSEFFPNLDLVTQHGVVTDPIVPLHKPVRFRPFGVIKRTLSADLLDDYVFQFDTIPPPYTYIEFKIEQEGQYNPWMNTTISEELFLSVTYQTTDAWHTAGQKEVLNLNNKA